MRIEAVQLLGGETGQDFVADEDGTERFSARLMDGETDLVVTWTDNLPWTVLRLREVQRLAGGSDRIKRIVGLASDRLETSILAGAFDEDRASRMLSRSLGGVWHIQTIPRQETG